VVLRTSYGTPHPRADSSTPLSPTRPSLRGRQLAHRALSFGYLRLPSAVLGSPRQLSAALGGPRRPSAALGGPRQPSAALGSPRHPRSRLPSGRLGSPANRPIAAQPDAYATGRSTNSPLTVFDDSELRQGSLSTHQCLPQWEDVYCTVQDKNPIRNQNLVTYFKDLLARLVPGKFYIFLGQFSKWFGDCT